MSTLIATCRMGCVGSMNGTNHVSVAGYVFKLGHIDEINGEDYDRVCNLSVGKRNVTDDANTTDRLCDYPISNWTSPNFFHELITVALPRPER